MRAQDRSPSFFRCWLRPMLVGVAVGLIVSVGMLMLMALLVQTLDVPRVAVLPMAIAAAAIGAFSAGLTAAAVSKQRGLVHGLVCGLVLWFLILAAGFSRYAGVSAGNAAIKLAVLVLTGAIGGVLGVNMRKR